jgi:predicted ATPase
MITRLQIENFKSLQSVDVPLKPLSLFTGLNGMGKSSFIQALLLLQQSYEQQVNRRSWILNGPLVGLGTGIDVLSEGAESEIISLRLWVDDMQSPFEWHLKSDSDADVMELDKFSLPEEIKRLAGDNNLSHTTPDSIEQTDDIKQAVNYLPFLKGEKTQYLSAERASPQLGYPTSAWEVNQRRQIGKHGEFTAHFLSVHQDEPVEFSTILFPDVIGQETPDTLIRQVGAWLNEISPGLRLEATLNREFSLARLGYSYQTAVGYTRPFRPGNVGFGLSYVLPVLTAILSARPGSLLIIENPESHIHPRGQSKLGELLALAAQNNVQLLVETHSDHVLNGVRVAVKKYQLDPERVGLYFFERAEEQLGHQTHIIQPKLDKDGRIDSWPRGFFDEWNRNLRELL